jgi:hypothetical protein
VAYLAWIFVSLGALPRSGAHSFATARSEGGGVGAFLAQIEPVVGSSLAPNLFYVFSGVVLLTSYLSLSLSLTDILDTSIQRFGRWRPRGRIRRLALVGVCFVPPLLVVVVYPNAFVPLLGVASMFCVVTSMLFPALALWRLKAKGPRALGLVAPSYRVLAGWGGFIVVIAAAAGILVLQVLNMMGDLPQ